MILPFFFFFFASICDLISSCINLYPVHMLRPSIECERQGVFLRSSFAFAFFFYIGMGILLRLN